MLCFSSRSSLVRTIPSSIRTVLHRSFSIETGSRRKRRVTLLPGDAKTIGPEITESVVEVFTAAGIPIEWEPIQCSIETDSKTKKVLIPDSLIDSIEKNRIVLKGHLSADTKNDASAFDIALNKKFDLFANVVPVRVIPIPGSTGSSVIADGLQFVIVRENTEGFYSGLEHEVVPGVVEMIKVVTEKASTRIARFALQLAESRGRNTVIPVHKANIMKMADGMFLEACRRIGREEFPDITISPLIVDNATMQMVAYPEKFDKSIIVTPNLYGSIMKAIGGALSSGVVGAYNIGFGDLAIFESGDKNPGSSIAGKNLANPAALLRASILLLHHIQFTTDAYRIETALDRVLRDGKVLTRDLGGHAKTSDFTRAVIDALDE